MTITGRVWIFGDEINTDLIFPHTAFRLPPEEQTKLVFSDNRPGWAEQVQAGDVIVAGHNFGTGSSRPGGALLKRLGISCLIAESVNGLFYRNCISYGFPALQCPDVTILFKEGDTAFVDLETGIVRNERTGQELHGMGLSGVMLDTILAGGIEEVLKRDGYID